MSSISSSCGSAGPAQEALIAQLLELSLQQALEPAVDIALLNAQLRAQVPAPAIEGLGEVVDVYA